jgi:alpha-maltose-1-phosphate synthase
LSSPTIILNQVFGGPSDGQIYGIHTATQGFLDAYLTHVRPEELHFRSHNIEQDKAIAKATKDLGYEIRVKKSISGNDIPNCAIFYSLPQANQFWMRHALVPRQYSICGINHSLTGSDVYNQLRDLFLAPTEVWDAIVCTSRASKSVIEGYFRSWSDYLSHRGYPKWLPELQMPVIPLGIDTSELNVTVDAKIRGRRLRQSLGIAEDDFVGLFLGRLNFSSKAHPLPMFVGLQQVSAELGKKVHLIQAGWYPSKVIESTTLELARQVAPSVKVHDVGSVSGQERLDVFAAADVFISLSDNIQETFGLTLIEAMSCGLPVVASDWDGCRDTVIHGQTGFLVSTVMSPPRTGPDIGLEHGISGRSYNRYLMDAAQATAINIGEVRDALVNLGRSRELRTSMGEAGRRRAVHSFDWRTIIKAYQALWAELEAMRGTEPIRHSAPNPHHPDPFTLFESFASHKITDESAISLSLALNAKERTSIGLRSLALRTPGDLLLSDEGIVRIVALLEKSGDLSLGSILTHMAGSKNRTVRSILWLVKIGALEICV